MLIKEIQQKIDETTAKQALVREQVSELDGQISETELDLLSKIEGAVGFSRQPAIIETLRRKVANLKGKKNELAQVTAKLKDKLSALEEDLRKARQKDRAIQLMASLLLWKDRIDSINSLIDTLSKDLAGMQRSQNPLGNLSDLVLELYGEGRKAGELIDIDQIRNNFSKLFVRNLEPEEVIQTLNLNTESALNRFSSAVQGSGSYSEARPRARTNNQKFIPEGDLAPSEEARQKFEKEYWKDGGPPVRKIIATQPISDPQGRLWVKREPT